MHDSCQQTDIPARLGVHSAGFCMNTGRAVGTITYLAASVCDLAPDIPIGPESTGSCVAMRAPVMFTCRWLRLTWAAQCPTSPTCGRCPPLATAFGPRQSSISTTQVGHVPLCLVWMPLWCTCQTWGRLSRLLCPEGCYCSKASHLLLHLEWATGKMLLHAPDKYWRSCSEDTRDTG